MIFPHSWARLLGLGKKYLKTLMEKKDQTFVNDLKEITKDLMIIHRGQIMFVILHSFISCEVVLMDLEQIVTL
jgi:hypothetical protein